jgi:hypothetical protein
MQSHVEKMAVQNDIEPLSLPNDSFILLKEEMNDTHSPKDK